MRRSDREVTDKSEILDILQRCDTLRVGIQRESYPYIVPVSFGLDTTGHNVAVYFHCAKEGLKTDLINKNPNVFIEGDIFSKVEKTANGITTRYESVMGFGRCVEAESMEEICAGLEAILAHYGYAGYPLDRCKGLARLRVYKVLLESLTGKRNLPE